MDEEGDTQREHPGEEHADDGVRTQAGAARDRADSEGGADGSDGAAQDDGETEHVGDDDAGECGVAHRVTDEAHPLQDHERADHRTCNANKGARDQRAHEEVVRERLEEEIDRIHAWPS